jgi:hypothetical protein
VGGGGGGIVGRWQKAEMQEALSVSGSGRSCKMGSMRIRVCNCVNV